MGKMVTDCDVCGEIALCEVTPEGGKYCGCDALAVLDSLPEPTHEDNSLDTRFNIWDDDVDSLPEPTHEDNSLDTRFNIWDDDEELFLDAIQSQLEAA